MATDTIEEEVVVDPDATEGSEAEAEVEESFLRRWINPKNKNAKILIGLFVVMVVEGAAIYMILPSDKSAANKTANEEGGDIEEGGGTVNPNNLEEVQIGDFRTTNRRPESGATIHVNFHLTVTVSKSQAAAFSEAVSSRHKSRIRQAVIEVVRSSSRQELDDSKLTVMKRMIRRAINKVLGNNAVYRVIISDYDTMDT